MRLVVKSFSKPTDYHPSKFFKNSEVWITIAPMTYRHFKHEGWLYALAFLLALGLRLIQLGVMPLTDLEAAPALQALHITQGLNPTLSPHPFYILFRSMLILADIH